MAERDDTYTFAYPLTLQDSLNAPDAAGVGGEGDDDTQAALDRLFGGDMDGEAEQGMYAGHTDLSGTGEVESSQAIETSLSAEGGRDRRDTMNTSLDHSQRNPSPVTTHPTAGDSSSFSINPTHEPIPSPAVETASPSSSTPTSTDKPKRKATSRANMLTRGGACEFCKRRKLKCSAEVPACAMCAKMGKECVYSQVKQRSRVRVLEDRLAELERRMSAPEAGGGGEAGGVGVAQGIRLEAGQGPINSQGKDEGRGRGSASDEAPEAVTTPRLVSEHGQGTNQGDDQNQPHRRVSREEVINYIPHDVDPFLSGLSSPHEIHRNANAPTNGEADLQPVPWATLTSLPVRNAPPPTQSSSTSQQTHLTQHSTPFGAPYQSAIPMLPHAYPGALPYDPLNPSEPAAFALPGMGMGMGMGMSGMTSDNHLASFPSSQPGHAALAGNATADASGPIPDLTGLIQAAVSPGATATFARVESGQAPWEGLSAGILARATVRTVLGGTHSFGSGVRRGGEGEGEGEWDCDASVGESLVSHLLHILLTRLPEPLRPFIRSPSLFLARYTSLPPPLPITPSSTPPHPSQLPPHPSQLPPHPALLLSLLPFLLPLSPSPTLRRPPTIPSLTAALLPLSRSLGSEALSAGDPRVIDIIAAQGVRSGVYYYAGRFLDGWVEGAGAVGLAWAGGLGKMGGVGEGFGKALRMNGEGEGKGREGQQEERYERYERYERRVELERELRVYRWKGVVLAPPRDAVEYGERVELFWELYNSDKAGALGWGWPSNFDEDEITTPLPLDDYENPELLLNPEYITDLFDPPDDSDPGSAPRSNSASSTFISPSYPIDTNPTPTSVPVPIPFTVPHSHTHLPPPEPYDPHANQTKAWARSLALAYRASRLFDQPSSLRSMKKTKELQRATEGYMRVYPMAKVASSGEWGRLEGPRNEVWMLLHLTMSFIHGRFEVDARMRNQPDQVEADAHLDRCIQSLFKVAEGIDLARESGDFDFEGYGIMSALSWQSAGRTAYKLAQRLEEEDVAMAAQMSPEEFMRGQKARERRKRDCTALGDRMVDAMLVLGKRIQFSGLAAQLVQNVKYGNEVKIGEWERPDYAQ